MFLWYYSKKLLGMLNLIHFTKQRFILLFIYLMTKDLKLIPLEDHILVQAIEEENKTKSWILLPESKEKPSKWEVIAVWEGKILDNGSRAPIDVKIGDIVYFTKYSPDELEVDGTKYLVIKQSSLLARQW
jgi:chaperonin GroES